MQNSQIQRIIFVFFCVLTPLHYKILFKFQEFLNAGFTWTGGLSHRSVEIDVIYEWLSFVWFIADSAFLVFFSPMRIPMVMEPPSPRDVEESRMPSSA